SDNPSRWSAALDRYRRDGKSTDHSALEEPTDDLPEDEVGRRGSRSKHDCFASLQSLDLSKSGYALTEPTAAMSSSSFYLAKEEGRDAFDFVVRHAGTAASGRTAVSGPLTRASRRWKPLQGRLSGGPVQLDRGEDHPALLPRGRRRTET
ncbi:hypothetical protein THAOC_08996, partial [Thalassiosira oceanica]